MSREESLVRSLVEMADTLVDDYDVVDLLTGLADRCVSLLGVAAAGVMLASPDGELRLVASSSEAMRVLEVFELQTQEGPCLDAYRTGERVEHEHLRAGTGRWPRFATVALEAGFRSAFALPLRLRDKTIGATNLFHAEQTPMDERDVIVARAFADLAAISVLQHRVATETQAKGIISERDGVDLAEAFNRLRNHARNNNLRLTAVAQAAIAGTILA